MATTTTNFGWDIPQSTDLVKDGATAIAALGQDIDTALVDLKGGTTGQVLAKASNTDLDFTWSSVDPLTILDAKGDLISATAADTPARLAVGSNGQVLTADSAEATGLKWATPSSPSLIGCLLTKSSAQSVADETSAAITFDGESFDTDGFHSNVTNTSRITIPTGKGGKYLFTGTLDYAANATGRRRLSFWVDGGDEIYVANQLMAVSTASQTTVLTASIVIQIDAAEYIELVAFQGSGGALDVRQFNTSFSAIYLGA